ncbi:MAG TPA: hypothetical protein PLO51_04830, partial [Candidatus Micrarchaeota archaeon]|nr:hypothetical protein [Candidatus Micrarchaeota archaeon]
MRKNKESFLFLALSILFLAPFFTSIVYSATLSGTGCSNNGDCVVSSSQTIDHGTSYNFSSLVINPGVTVTVA